MLENVYGMIARHPVVLFKAQLLVDTSILLGDAAETGEGVCVIDQAVIRAAIVASRMGCDRTEWEATEATWFLWAASQAGLGCFYCRVLA